MAGDCLDIDKDRARFYSSLLSRAFFERLIKDGNDTKLLDRISRVDSSRTCVNMSICNYLRIAYNYLAKNYRNEYVYKNALIRKLIHAYSSRNSVIFSEFKVGRSYADLVMFNGESRVYEIKTELDTSSRLASQLNDYKGFFQKIYIVTHSDYADKYAAMDESVGLIALSYHAGSIQLRTIREPIKNNHADASTIMKTLHTSEYKKLVMKLYGALPPVGSFQMYNACLNILRMEEGSLLQEEANKIIKERKSVTRYLRRYERGTSHLIQICLSLHIQPNEYENLRTILKQVIA